RILDIDEISHTVAAEPGVRVWDLETMLAGHGYGLGLYLCRRLVEAMGGRIWVVSEPGNGATFRFALPLAE
ncbi:MAG: hypothetical protein HY761_11300, partial [Candidatus Omnitrophica bacterium]|nr:hypothetical protein [Candidatus Omnitrophota bacterium]